MDINFGYYTVWDIHPITPKLFLGVTGRGRNPKVRRPVMLIQDSAVVEGFRQIGWVRKLHGYRKGRFEATMLSKNAWGASGPDWTRLEAETYSIEEAERLLIKMGEIIYG